MLAPSQGPSHALSSSCRGGCFHEAMHAVEHVAVGAQMWLHSSDSCWWCPSHWQPLAVQAAASSALAGLNQCHPVFSLRHGAACLHNNQAAALTSCQAPLSLK